MDSVPICIVDESGSIGKFKLMVTYRCHAEFVSQTAETEGTTASIEWTSGIPLALRSTLKAINDPSKFQLALSYSKYEEKQNIRDRRRGSR